jgi:hypothetical protein
VLQQKLKVITKGTRSYAKRIQHYYKVYTATMKLNIVVDNDVLMAICKQWLYANHPLTILFTTSSKLLPLQNSPKFYLQIAITV